MSKLERHTNEVTADQIGPLGPQTEVQPLTDMTPVLATPAAVAAGVAVTAAAFGAGYAVEETADG
ncbi:MAG: hypothetical protein JHC95_03970 [Solirubrobacteraceae bacterium]|nr:hypothetical protein [Solirubrobacteraceae bacterium]